MRIPLVGLDWDFATPHLHSPLSLHEILIAGTRRNGKGQISNN